MYPVYIKEKMFIVLVYRSFPYNAFVYFLFTFAVLLYFVLMRPLYCTPPNAFALPKE